MLFSFHIDEIPFCSAIIRCEKKEDSYKIYLGIINYLFNAFITAGYYS